MNVKFPRGLVIDLNDIPNDFEQQIERAFKEYTRGKADAYSNIKEEVADVLIMARQLRYLLGYDDIDRIINEKLNRQMRRIEDESV